LDRLLKKKAEQGVRIYVMVYKEVSRTMARSYAAASTYMVADSKAGDGVHESLLEAYQGASSAFCQDFLLMSTSMLSKICIRISPSCGIPIIPAVRLF